MELSFSSSHPNSKLVHWEQFREYLNAAEAVGNAILHGTFSTNNLSGVRKDSAKSAGHLGAFD